MIRGVLHGKVWTDLAGHAGCVDKLGRSRVASDAGKCWDEGTSVKELRNRPLTTHRSIVQRATAKPAFRTSCCRALMWRSARCADGVSSPLSVSNLYLSPRRTRHTAAI